VTRSINAVQFEYFNEAATWSYLGGNCGCMASVLSNTV